MLTAVIQSTTQLCIARMEELITVGANPDAARDAAIRPEIIPVSHHESVGDHDHLLGLINVLQKGNTTLMDMRHRFLSTFKRDKTTSELNSLDKGWIAGGNLIAHGGNSKYD